MTNVIMPMAKVSPTGRPTRSNDAVGLLLKKHWRHIPPRSDAGATVSVCEAVSVPPSPSVTVSVVVYVPYLLYEWLMVCPLPLPPSPKFQVYE